jgi:hypothetical protein
VTSRTPFCAHPVALGTEYAQFGPHPIMSMDATDTPFLIN